MSGIEVVYREGVPVIELAYDGLQRIQDRDERTGDLLAEYTYVQGQLHKWRTPSTEHWVFIELQGGWPRHLFDDAGVLTDSFDLDWNGQELLHQGTTDAPIGWGGWHCDEA